MVEGDAKSPAPLAETPRRGSDARGGDSRVARAYRSFTYSSLGLEMALAILIGFGIGYYLDEEFGTDPYLTLVFLGVGIAAAFKALYRVARQAKSLSDEADPQPPASKTRP